MKFTTLTVNFFGGPGLGKSTTALGLAYKLKLNGIEAEYIPEYARELTYEEKYEELKQQDKIAAEQLRRLYISHNKCEVQIVDSALPFSLFYAGKNCDPVFKNWLLEEFHKFDNHNILIERNPHIPYSTVGRIQDLPEACMIDDGIKSLLEENSLQYHPWRLVSGEENVDGLFDHIYKLLGTRAEFG